MSQECYLAVTFLSGAGGLVEAEPFHITNQDVDNAPLELPIAVRGVARAPLHERRRTPVRQVLRWLPVGILNGWQYAAALFVGLLVLGNYGPGDQRRDPKRLFLACALATALPLWMTIWSRGVELVTVQYALI